MIVAACSTVTTGASSPTSQVSEVAAIPEGPPPPEPDNTIPDLAEVVAEQIRTGNTQCDRADDVEYEACLLYQSALYRWGKDLTPENALAASKDSTFQALYTIAVARTVPILAATDVYAFQEKATANFRLPGVDADVILDARHGICGNHSALAIALLERAGLQARYVRFFYTDPVSELRNSHVVVEVWIDGAWRLVDTTYGTYWGDLEDMASLEEVMEDPSGSAFWNSALVPDRDPTAANFAPFEPYRANPSILRGEVGTITLNLDGVETLEHVPSYIGDNQSDGFYGGIEFDLDLPGNTLVLEVRVVSGDGDICVDQTCVPFPDGPMNLEFEAKGDSQRLWVRNATDVAYVVLDSIVSE